MLSKAKIKYIKSLHLKKNRMQDKLFIVEGSKSVLEFLYSEFKVHQLYGTEQFWLQNESILTKIDVLFELATEKELSQAGFLSSNNTVLALVQIPDYRSISLPLNEWTIALDSINDPGNLGTIIRIADWYGIKQIILSNNSVDVYNPKVVTASKGSLTRVGVNYSELDKILIEYSGVKMGAAMEGQDIHTLNEIKGGIVLMGSESHGISLELESLLTNKITIPKVGGAESLNVAVATAIICDNLIGKKKS